MAKDKGRKEVKKPKKTKEEHLADLKRLDKNYNQFVHKLNANQRKGME